MPWQVRTKVQAMLALQTGHQPALSWMKSSPLTFTALGELLFSCYKKVKHFAQQQWFFAIVYEPATLCWPLLMATWQDEHTGGHGSGFTPKCLTLSTLGGISAISTKELTFLYFEQTHETEYRNAVRSQNVHTDVLLNFSVLPNKPTSLSPCSSQDTLSNQLRQWYVFSFGKKNSHS